MLLHQLSIFVKVAEEKSFSRAAENIYLSQSTISTHISNLEKFFGQKLFDRSGKEIMLTHAGEKLFPIAKEMLTLENSAVQALSDSIWKIEGNLRIAASSVPAQYIAPKLISKFTKKYPEIKVTLDLLDSKHVADQLIKGEADVGILSNQYFLDQLKFIPIMEEKLVLITPPNVNFPNGFTKTDFAKYPILFRKYGSGTQVTVEKILHSAGVDIAKLNVIGYFDSVQVVKQCVKEGMGISIISEIAAEDYAKYDLINVYELSELSQSRTFYMAYKETRTLSPLVKEFILHYSEY